MTMNFGGQLVVCFYYDDLGAGRLEDNDKA